MSFIVEKKPKRLHLLFFSLILPLLALLFLLHQMAPLFAAATPDFTSVWASNENALTFSLAWGDADGDGDLDLLVANDVNAVEQGIDAAEYRNQIYRNDGDNNFTLAWTSDEGEFSVDAAWGDLDGDGDLDFVLADDGNNPGVDGENVNQVYRNDGDFNFTLMNAALPADNGVRTNEVKLGDLNGDGDLDILFVNGTPPGNGQINQILVNNGNFNFTQVNWEISPVLETTMSGALADFDNDGDLDFAVGNYGAPNRFYQNQGNFNFTEIFATTETSATNSIAWGDINNDGFLDLIVGNGGSSTIERNQIYLNDLQNSGTFIWSWTSDDTYQTDSISVADINKDGWLDFAAGNRGPDIIYDKSLIYLNDGAGNIATTGLEFETDAKDTPSIAWGDIDNNGTYELGVGNRSQDNQIFENGNGYNLTAAWESNATDMGFESAWGDIDNDGDLDFITGISGANLLYLNDGDNQFTLASGAIPEDSLAESRSVAFGDMDGDGFLDLAVGNNGPDRVYRNNGNGTFALYWETLPSSEDFNAKTNAIEWGDYDGDGDLDLAIAYIRTGQISSGGPGCDGTMFCANRIYRNDGSGVFTQVWQAPAAESNMSSSEMIWGDVDNDGDLDFATGNEGNFNTIYKNQGGQSFELFQELDTTAALDTKGLSFGDVDGDGDLDLAVGNWEQVNQIFRNDGEDGFNLLWESTGDAKRTESILLNDVDGDGDLDLIVSNGILVNNPQPGVQYEGQVNQIFFNNGEGDFTLGWESLDERDVTVDIAAADADNDGDVELLTTNQRLNPTVKVLENRLYETTDNLPHSHPHLTVHNPANGIAAANQFGTSIILTDTVIPIEYAVFDDKQSPIGELNVFYSMNGGGEWLEAVPAAGSTTANIQTDAYPNEGAANTHTFNWDTFASGFFGQSDNVVLRFETSSQTTGGVAGTFLYPDIAAGPILRTSASATTLPMRVRGTQIRVYQDSVAPGNEVEGAIVYRLPANSAAPAALIADAIGNGFVTDQQGYLQGRGQLQLNDQLVALYPVETTAKYTRYHSSATPNNDGLFMATVAQEGVQNLVVSDQNPLLIFNLTVSLEWDARHDTAYLNQLESDLVRASEILFDLTNGQVALGNIEIYQRRENWKEADIIITANGNQRPSAILGGVVQAEMDDVDVNGTVLTNAYVPGQIRIGARWNRFGELEGTIGEDWPRTMAHELGHYLLHIPDNYLGLSTNGFLSLVDCKGSAMTDPYTDPYSEFVNPANWTTASNCLDTLQEVFMGRSDWDTIQTFYPYLNADLELTGPKSLPLGITQINFHDSGTPLNEFADPFFNILDTNDNPAVLLPGSTQGYIIQKQNNTDPTDDYVIALGSAVGNVIEARGIENGDRLCLFDYGTNPQRIGCVDAANNLPEPINLETVSNWEPAISVSQITTRTFAITVTNVPDDNLDVQVLSSIGDYSNSASMTKTGDVFHQDVEMPEPTFGGYVRIWVPDASPDKEMIVDFLDIEDWGARSIAWGAPSLAWGARSIAWGARSIAWGAPTMSSDGQVSIIPLDSPFSGDNSFTIHKLENRTLLPSWLSPVGQAYVLALGNENQDSGILFQYLGRDVPPGYENNLAIYYSADDGSSWVELDTELNSYANLASAQVAGSGIYYLVATVEVLPMAANNWYTFGYPIQTDPTSPPEIGSALASVDGSYSIVYHYEGTMNDPWLLYDPTVAPEFADMVNTLDVLEFAKSYWIYATQADTLYFGVENQNRSANDLGPIANQTDNVSVPPATYYGTVTPFDNFTPQAGMTMTAFVNGNACGSATISSNNGEFVFVIQVEAQNITGAANGCGAYGDKVEFRVNNLLIGVEQAWDNTQAHHLNLNGPSYTLYLPIVLK